jgi:uncharacterized protein (DUF608 family)
MDVEYYGPNPVIQGWYLAALEAGGAMAAALGEKEFAARVEAVLESGRARTEEQLWNGSWYRQVVIPPRDFERIAPALRHPAMGANDPDDPEYQIGDGCILDQLVGDTYARLVGLDPIYDPARSSVVLDSIHRENFVADLGTWANGMRTYGGRGEAGYLVESYPSGMPRHPMPYWSEVWTGLEYVYAIGLIQAGRVADAEAVVGVARARYDGSRRSPFDETECGHHYARPLASWGLVVAHSGFRYDGVEGRVEFAAASEAATWFWSNGHAWGTVRQEPGMSPRVRLTVVEGHLRLTTLVVGGEEVYRDPAGTDLLPGADLSA